VTTSCPWTQLEFNAANFAASGSMTWTVDGGDQLTYAYTIVGKTITLSIVLASTTTGGSASSELHVALPPGVAVMRTMANLMFLSDGASFRAVLAHVAPGVAYVRITNLDFSNFSLVSNALGIQGEITFEIQ
jgi:hypothetical protein